VRGTHVKEEAAPCSILTWLRPTAGGPSSSRVELGWAEGIWCGLKRKHADQRRKGYLRAGIEGKENERETDQADGNLFIGCGQQGLHDAHAEHGNMSLPISDDEV
jgi:hypothetical protein